MNIEAILNKAQRYKQLVFSFFWIIFVALQWDIFYGLLEETKNKLLNDNDLMLPFAIIEYGLISVSIFAPIVAVNMWALFSGEPRLGIPFRILSIKYDILIPYSLKNVTLVIVNYMKTMLMFSVCLAITSLLDLMDSSDPIGKLAERLAHELISIEHYKMIAKYFMERADLFSLIIAIIPFACMAPVFIITHIVFLTVSVLPLYSILILVLSIFSLLYPLKRSLKQ